MSSPVIQYITLRANVHSTEVEERVKQALNFFLDGMGIDDKKGIIETTKAEGHFGNPISICSVNVKKRSKCKNFIPFLRHNLETKYLEELRNEIKYRLDEGQTLHLRFDKQAAFTGQAKPSSSSDAIIVKIKITTYPKNWECAREFLEDMCGEV